MEFFGFLILSAVLATNGGGILQKSNALQDVNVSKTVSISKQDSQPVVENFALEEKLLKDYVERQSWIGRKLSLFFEKRLPVALRQKEIKVIVDNRLPRLPPSKDFTNGFVLMPVSSVSDLSYSMNRIMVHTNEQGLIFSVKLE